MEHADSICGTSSTTQTQLETLLRAVEAELVNVVPDDRRAELLEEMRAHLNAMLAARISDGLSEAVAWKNTCAAFGDGHEIGRELAEEWVRKPRVERQGAPLSRRARAALIGKSLGTSLVIFPVIFLGMPLLRRHGLDGTFFLMAMCVLFAIGWRKRQRSNATHPVPWTPTAIWGTALAVIHILMTWASVQFGGVSDMRWVSQIYTVWNVVFIVGTVVMMVRYRREVNTVRPWRALPQYKESPVAAEEEFRLSPSIGLATGLTCMGLMACLAGAQSLGVWAVVGVIAIVVGLGVTVARWLR